MIQMKKLAAAVVIAAASMGAQATTLGATDFAFTGANTNTTVGGWSFVTFADMDAGTTIYFTDTNVLQTTPISGLVFSTTAETFWSWTASTAVSAGTSVSITGATAAATVASTGAITNKNATAFNVSGSGDIVYAYQAASYATNYTAANITFLGAISNRTTPYATSDDPGAVTGLSGIQVRQFRVDNLTATRYTEFTPQTITTDTPYSTIADLKTALANTGNWTTVAASNSIVLSNDVLVTPVPEASTYAMLLAGLGMIGFMARRRTQG